MFSGRRPPQHSRRHHPVDIATTVAPTTTGWI
jgi:hypothetical protein